MAALERQIARLHDVVAKCGMNFAPIIVLGMHRSGTTMIAKTLEMAGVFMGTRLSGNHEARVMQDANRQIFDYFQAGWINPDRVPNPSALMTGFDGLCSDITARLCDDMPLCFFDSRQDGFVRWGFKDPRTSVTAGVFLRMFPNASAIFIHRKGEDVAASILKRELRIRKKYPASEGAKNEDLESILMRAVMAWNIYNERTLAVLTQFERYAMVSYEEVVASPQFHLQQAFGRVGVEISSEVIANADISAERVGGSVEFAKHLGGVHEYLARSSVREMLEKRIV